MIGDNWPSFLLCNKCVFVINCPPQGCKQKRNERWYLQILRSSRFELGVQRLRLRLRVESELRSLKPCLCSAVVLFFTQPPHYCGYCEYLWDYSGRTARVALHFFPLLALILFWIMWARYYSTCVPSESLLILHRAPDPMQSLLLPLTVIYLFLSSFFQELLADDGKVAGADLK